MWRTKYTFLLKQLNTKALEILAIIVLRIAAVNSLNSKLYPLDFKYFHLHLKNRKHFVVNVPIAVRLWDTVEWPTYLVEIHSKKKTQSAKQKGKSNKKLEDESRQLSRGATI